MILIALSVSADFAIAYKRVDTKKPYSRTVHVFVALPEWITAYLMIEALYFIKSDQQMTVSNRQIVLLLIAVLVYAISNTLN